MTAEEIKALRQSTGLTQEQFAHKIVQMTWASVHRWETGKTRMTPMTAEAIKARVAAYLAEHPRNA